MIRRFLIAALLVACHPLPEPHQVKPIEGQDPDVPPPLTPAAATDADRKACARLVELRCAEGTPSRGKCEDSFARARTNESRGNAGEVDAVAACVAGAATITVVRGCGSKSTMQVECR